MWVKNMGKKYKKMIAPIVIIIFLCLFVIFQMVGFFMIPIPFVKVIAIIIGICSIGALCYVLWERYKEIEGGEEDDIDNY